MARRRFSGPAQSSTFSITLCFQSPHHHLLSYSCHSSYLKLLRLARPQFSPSLPLPQSLHLPSPHPSHIPLSHNPHNLSCLTISGPLTSPGGAASPPAGAALLDETSCAAARLVVVQLSATAAAPPQVALPVRHTSTSQPHCQCATLLSHTSLLPHLSAAQPLLLLWCCCNTNTTISGDS